MLKSKLKTAKIDNFQSAGRIKFMKLAKSQKD